MKKLLTLLIFTLHLFATQQNADNLAKFTAIDLFNLDSQALKETIHIYVKNHPKIKAVEVIEGGKKFFIYYKKNNNNIFYKPVPKEYFKLPIYSSPISYNNMELGLIKIYYDDNLLSELLTKAEKLWLENNPVVKVYNEPDWAPYNYNEEGEAKGYSIQYFNLLASKVGLDLKYISNIPWNEGLNRLKKGDLDIVLNIAKNSSREKFFDYTDKSYLSLKNGFITKKSNPLIDSFEQLKGKKLAIVEDFNVQEILKNYPEIEPFLVDNFREVLKAVSNGKAYAGHGSSKVFQHLSNTELISNIHFSEDNLKPTKLYMATKKGNNKLLSILNKAQKQVRDDELFKLRSRWLSRISPFQEDLQLTTQEKQYLKNKNHLTLCIKPNLLPYEGIKNGKYVGIGADYMGIISNKLNLQLKIAPVKSNLQTLKLLRAKKCDIKPLIVQSTIMPYRLSTPYLKESISLSTRIEEPFIKELDLDKTYVVVPAQHGITKFIKQRYPNIKTISAKTIKDALTMVAKRKAFGYLGKSLSSIHHIQKDFSSTLKVMNEFKEIDISIGIKEDDKILLNIINKTLASIDEQTKIKIRNNWSTTTIQQKVDYTIAIMISIFFIIIATLTLVWNIRLKKEIAKREELEKKELENQKLISEQSKLAAMGEMIGNIAHQWRQPLSIISTSASGAKIQKELSELADKDFVHYMDTIIDQTQYLSKTIDDFKNFIKGDREKEEFNLKENIESFLHLVEGTIKKHQIEVVTDLDSNITLVGHPNELIQGFINIFNNSKDAMDKCDTKLLFITTKQENNKISITLKDSGGGIPKNILPHIFEPYFTTKHKSQGTGLGLHMTYNLIVEGMGGTLQAKNKTYSYNKKEYRGAEFIITLPLS